MLSYGETTRVVLCGTSYSERDATNLPPLDHVKKNIEALARIFRDPNTIGLDDDNIITILDEPESTGFLRKIREAAQSASNTLLVYYAGHGLYGDSKERLYLCAVSTSDATKHIDGIGVNSLRSEIANSPATKRILILDCCYAGRALDGEMSSAEETAHALDIEGTYAIAAVPGDRKALAPPGERYTSFTGTLIDVLDHGIADQGEEITIDGVFDRTQEVLHRKADIPIPQKINWQKGEDFIFALNRYQAPVDVGILGKELKTLAEQLEGQNSSIERLTSKMEMISERQDKLEHATDNKNVEIQDTIWEFYDLNEKEWKMVSPNVRVMMLDFKDSGVYSYYLLMSMSLMVLVALVVFGMEPNAKGSTGEILDLMTWQGPVGAITVVIIAVCAMLAAAVCYYYAFSEVRRRKEEMLNHENLSGIISSDVFLRATKTDIIKLAGWPVRMSYVLATLIVGMIYMMVMVAIVPGVL